MYAHAVISWGDVSASPEACTVESALVEWAQRHQIPNRDEVEALLVYEYGHTEQIIAESLKTLIRVGIDPLFSLRLISAVAEPLGIQKSSIMNALAPESVAINRIAEALSAVQLTPLTLTWIRHLANSSALGSIHKRTMVPLFSRVRGVNDPRIASRLIDAGEVHAFEAMQYVGPMLLSGDPTPGMVQNSPGIRAWINQRHTPLKHWAIVSNFTATKALVALMDLIRTPKRYLSPCLLHGAIADILTGFGHPIPPEVRALFGPHFYPDITWPRETLDLLAFDDDLTRSLEDLSL